MFTTIKKLAVLSCMLLSPLAAADSLKHIQQTGEIELCVHPDQMPFSKRAGKPQGFQVDMAKAFAEKLDVALNISWIMPRRQAKKTGCDFYTGVARLGDGDSKYMLISDPYLRLEFNLVTRSGEKKINSIRDLKSKVVGVSPGSVASHALNQNNIDLAVRFRDEASRLQALIDGEIDVALVTNVASGWIQKQHGQQFQVVDAEKILNVELNYDYALGLRKADEETRKAFNKLLVDMKDDGTLGKIFKEYGLRSI
ncbi:MULTISPECIES: transporter substrate-binding domain-containing protein [unclassified Neptuniibacter]|uniref:substrate-binding periplasmic protein n=1 Tax=unclassified Neptuniibacter TaxID=2630693 RepID=UPI000C690226|nr:MULTISPECIES: transporter substrate-binding domain-containing protein [unclassified Neptuniibacter]MAY42802.1 hypothetical protein [Oceanospirillaceae bacterium]|tara:strand:- start:6326 stop:7087 length:762 start_codon:yes stop_codon:yes gene_type:complete